MKKGLFLLFCWVGLGGFFSETFGQIQRIDTIPSAGKGSVMGYLQDSTGYTIPMAHVFLIQGKDTVKLVSDLDGRFTYKGISSDTVRLWVSAVGYKTIEEDYIPSQHGADIRVLLKEEIFTWRK